jgi:hypothetical protein
MTFVGGYHIGCCEDWAVDIPSVVVVGRRLAFDRPLGFDLSANVVIVRFAVRWIRDSFSGQRLPDIERNDDAVGNEPARARAVLRRLATTVSRDSWARLDEFLQAEEEEHQRFLALEKELASARLDWRPEELMPEDFYAT